MSDDQLVERIAFHHDYAAELKTYCIRIYVIVSLTICMFSGDKIFPPRNYRIFLIVLHITRILLKNLDDHRRKVNGSVNLIML